MADFIEDRVVEYTPQEVVLELDGKRVFGWVRIRISRDANMNTKSTPSADGKHFWISNHGRWGTCELELTQNSTSMPLCRTMQRRRGTWGLTMTDKSGTTDQGTLTDCKCENDQGVSRSATEENYSFTFGGLISLGVPGLIDGQNEEFV